MAWCQLAVVVLGDEIVTRKGFLEGVFLGLAVADSSDGDGSHSLECCCTS
jgi:hypothetical protein